MQILVGLAVAVGLFLALPWLAVAFNRYCEAVNRLLAKRRGKRPDA